MDQKHNFDSHRLCFLSDDVRISMEKALNTSQIHRNPSFGTDNVVITEIENARNKLAGIVNVPAHLFFFNSLSAENDAAIVQASIFILDCEHIITCESESKAKIDFLKNLESSGKIKLDILEHDSNGKFDIQKFEQVLHSDNRLKLLTISHANRINGKMLPVKEISRLCQKSHVFFHLNTNLTVGKYLIDFKTLGPDFMSFGSRLLHGPNGISGLAVKPKIQINEKMASNLYYYLKSIELNGLPQIAGFETALIASIYKSDDYNKKMAELKSYFMSKIDTGLKLRCESNSLVNLLTIYTDTSKFSRHLCEIADYEGFAIECLIKDSTEPSKGSDLIIPLALNDELSKNEIDQFIEFLKSKLKEA